MNFLSNDVLFLIGLILCLMVLIYSYISTYVLKKSVEINIEEHLEVQNDTPHKKQNEECLNSLCNKIQNLNESTNEIDHKIETLNTRFSATPKNNNKKVYDDLIDTIDKHSNLDYNYDEKSKKVNWDYSKENATMSEKNLLYVGLSKYNNSKMKQLISILPQVMINYRYFKENDKLTTPQENLPLDGSLLI